MLGDRQRVLGVVLLAIVALLWSRTSAQVPAGGVVVRTDIEGDWASVVEPINAADRQKAESWDADILSQPERQTQAHPAQYWIRGPQPLIRIMRVLDPVTQQLLAYTIAGGWGRADDPIFLEEPFVRTHTWSLSLQGFADPLSNPFESVDELAGKPLGWVPFFPLGTKHTEFAQAHNLPFAATQGGKETMYPEYRETIQALARR